MILTNPCIARPFTGFVDRLCIPRMCKSSSHQIDKHDSRASRRHMKLCTTSSMKQPDQETNFSAEAQHPILKALTTLPVTPQRVVLRQEHGLHVAKIHLQQLGTLHHWQSDPLRNSQEKTSYGIFPSPNHKPKPQDWPQAAAQTNWNLVTTPLGPQTPSKKQTMLSRTVLIPKAIFLSPG